MMLRLHKKRLSQHLKELQRDNLINRKAYNVIPPKVEYSLTAIGESFIPVLKSMEDWESIIVKNVKS